MNQNNRRNAHERELAQETASGNRWEFWIDRGGTFTDVVARDPTGAIHVRKLLSENPKQYPDAALEGVRRVLGVAPGEAVPTDRIAWIKMGTTLATNALLERKGARVGLLTTQGFGDLLEIGYQDRPEIFALEIRKPESLVAGIAEVPERILADGTVRTALDEEEITKALARFKAEGIESIAVLFLHSFAYPEHEIRAGKIAREMGFAQVSLSHEVAREIKAVGRGDTTAADAYLTPLLRDYVEGLRNELGAEVGLRFMQSNGGLTDAERFTGKNAVLSGPAAGVVAHAHVSALAGLEKVIGFDMGGTSTDVSRFDGRYERVFETQIGGVRLKAPMMAIQTVAAGGGSLLKFESGRFVVGPESAGACPGPACYRLGGPAAVTDANLVLGRIQPTHFPACFGPSADEPLDAQASRARLESIASEVERATEKTMTIEEVAAGFVRIANENMAKPIKEISVAKGYDVQEYALTCFGGAAAQHACAIAESLGMKTILLHPFAGVLSAYGMGLADGIHTGVEAVLQELDHDPAATFSQRFEALESKGAATLLKEGYTEDEIAHIRSVDLRYMGVDAYLNVVLQPDEDLRETFDARHSALYGFVKADHPIEVVNVRVESVGRTRKPDETERPLVDARVPDDLAIDRVTVYFDGADGRSLPTSTPVYRRLDLEPGHRLEGPAMVIEDVTTIVIDPGWKAEMNGRGHLLLRHVHAAKGSRLSTESDPVMLELFNNLFMSVATQMGETLERVSHSVNIKERLDFSCAIFTEDGELIANAPHIPVHLGAMSESVRAILAERGADMQPGDVYLTNDPYHGGSHLPDLTVVSPVFDDEDRRVFFVANRGHHADIGGVAPGSMDPFSKSIDEEGVLIHDFCLVSKGQFHEDETVALLTRGPYPARNIEERLSDLRAQIAANAAGTRLLGELCARYGVDVVKAYMGHVRRNAALAMQETLEAIPDGVYTAEDQLDSGARIACKITIEGSRAVVDFDGTDAQLEGNLNAPRAVVIAAVLYCFRVLVGRSIPLNGGCLDPIELRIPEGSLLSPAYPAAVVGGNVETSMRVVDVVFKALGALAGGQGTMNNLTFGTAEWGYYETICGGAGAGPDFDGASAVHTHMTNTRITDPEVLERRYPVVLREFSIRRGSGGGGRRHGGDGVTRALEFLEEMSLGILSGRRTTRPYGVDGGEPGQPGQNWLRRAGEMQKLDAHTRLDVRPGDVIVIETPGGGGYGNREDAELG